MGLLYLFTVREVYSSLRGIGDKRVKLVDTDVSDENTVLISANNLKMGQFL